MILRELRVENFGPFYGEHSIRFAADGSSPVTLVFGENMRGKTTILNALRWCLYGEARERGGDEVPAHELLNYDAVDEGAYYYQVELDFDHGGDHFELQRHAQAKVEPERPSDLEKSVSCRINGTFVNEDDVKEVIANILHPEVSRFFLFDGEMLDEFEVLLADEDYQSKIVRDSIERILGVPALKYAVEDFDDLKGEASKRVARELKRREEHEELVQKAEVTQEEVERLREEVKTLEQKKSRLEQERSELRERRAQFEEVRADARRLDDIEREMEVLNKEREELVMEGRQALSDGWWQVAAGLAQSEFERVRDAAERNKAKREKLAQLRHSRELRKSSIAASKCDICGQEVSVKSVEKIEADIDTLEDDIQKLKDQGSEVADLDAIRRMSELQELTDKSELIQFKHAEKEARKKALDIRDLRREKSELQDRLKGFDRTEIRRVEHELEQVVRNLSKCEEALERSRDQLSQKRTDLGRIEQLIEDLPDTDQALAAQSSVYGFLRDCFESAIDEFRHSLREQVASEASEIFTGLTTEDDYERLDINERFGLKVIDGDGNRIERISAGAEQIRALALIGALNRSAVRDGPLVMDTPFGRLDKGHRRNILRFVPSFGTQVVLLVQSGELERGSGPYDELNGKIGVEYRIEKDGSATRSKLVRISEA